MHNFILWGHVGSWPFAENVRLPNITDSQLESGNWVRMANSCISCGVCIPPCFPLPTTQFYTSLTAKLDCFTDFEQGEPNFAKSHWLSQSCWQNTWLYAWKVFRIGEHKKTKVFGRSGPPLKATGIRKRHNTVQLRQNSSILSFWKSNQKENP